MESNSPTISAEPVVQHRHVQIQTLSKAIDNASNAQLWKALGQPDVPVIVMSNICTQIVQGVKTDIANLVPVLDQLTAFILTVRNVTKESVLLRAITKLLLWYCTQDDSTITFSVHASHSGHVHPFITLLQHNQVSNEQLLVEIDYALSHEVACVFPDKFFATFEPLFDTILLLPSTISPSMLINRITKCISTTSSESYDELRTEALNYLLSVAERSFRQDGTMPFLLLSEITYILVECSDLHALLESEDLHQKATELIYILLQTACDAAAANLPVLSYIQLIQQLMSATDLCDPNVPICKYNPELLWTSLSLMLYSAQTMDDQSILTDLLADILPSTSPSILRVALFPLIQTLTEVENDSSTNNVKLQILEMIQMIQGRPPPNDDVYLQKTLSIYQEMEHFKIGGFLQYAVSSIINREPSDMLKDSSADTVPRQMTMGIALLRLTPTLFEMSGEAPLQSVDNFVRIATKACSSSKKFPALLLLLHVLHESHDQAEYTNHILQVSIPSLVRSNDPVLTSKVLKIAMSLIQGRTPKHQGIFHKDTMTSLTCVGIRMLCTVYEKQPRVWQYLKVVILDWINYRKSGARGFSKRPLTVSEHQTEMAILLTTRKLFEEKPMETAQDILPGIVSLLQTVSDLSMPSIALIVLSINACVKADLLDARSIWTIVLSYVAAYVNSQKQESSIPVIKALCKFFEIVGGLKDDSEPVSAMRETILMEYIAVYIKSTIPEIKKASISALSCFQPTDIMSIMEERPKDSINTMLSDGAIHGYAGSLAKLMTYELDHMRRGLFREGDTAQSNRKPATESKCSQESTSQERQILQKIESEWKNFSVSPGLRSGYALASLFGYRVTSSPARVPADLTRQMSAALTDINLSDHLLIRIGSFSAWEALFEDAIGSSVESAERQTEGVIDDLLNRLASSKVPGLTCNILTALSGCIMALQKLSASAATTAAAKVMERLMPDYFVSKSSENAAASSLVLNEDVQFAVRFCIGNISECVISNERMIQSLIAQLLKDLQEHTSKVTIEAIVELQAFSSGYGLARLVAAMCGYSTKAEYIESLSNSTLATLLNLCFDARLSESAVLGIWMGLASRFDLNEVYSARQLAQQIITNYDIGKYMNNGKANLIGAFWLCAYATAQDGKHIQPNDIELISRVASKNINKDTALGQQLVVPYGYMLSHIPINADSFQYAQQYLLDLLNQQFNAVKTTESPMDTKVAAALTLSAMLGTDYLNPVIVEDKLDEDTLEVEHASAQDGKSAAQQGSNAWDFIEKQSLQQACPSRRDVMDVAIQQIGIGKSNVTGNLRAGRITAFTVGNLCRKALLQEQHKNSLNNPSDLEIMASTSAEPKSYSRLAQTTSWLRNVFDTLVEISAQPVHSISNNATMLLLALQQTIGPLAPVNWFPILLNLSKISTDIHLSCIHFASTHASSSTSLTEFIIVQLRQVATYLEKGQSVDDRVIQLLVSEVGLGKMMELAGLLEQAPSSTVGHHRRGVNAMLKPIKLSEERCFETVNALVSVFAKLSEDCRHTALHTLSLHLHDKSDKLTCDLHHLVYQQLLSRLVKDTNPPSDTIIQLTVQCSLASLNIENLLKDLDQVSSSDMLHSQVVVACEVCQRQAGTTQKSSVQYLSTILRSLIMFKGEVYTKTWTVLIHTIASDANTKNTLDKYQLLISMLDIVIIVLSLKASDRYSYAKRGIALGLRSVIEICWWAIDAPLQNVHATALEQASYLMGQVISSAQATGFVKHDQLLSRLFRVLEIAEEDRDLTAEAHVIQRIFVKTLRIVYASGSGPEQNGYKIL
ncbi:hypothetical protein K450DRAFT_225721 [Umbelopsis ramanniana AG]|uniref:ARM repeat superfamily protein n=1 Tax=Umbelopsis ramanniana AG TaxID=1314678 RepID=A0AAD5HFZ2_UMBRA|nr:uncharacterized protein K450DRAFT_225721 [Umbelopsis ramanniana AG]KAI8582977.1 hypothetical protein K450DRAFT_225721 [Umbelopsis ramanniana AG]